MPVLEHTNRLINEKSPYLLQHAHNPVDWYPWGDEAFAKAKAEDKPVFLSIGYSTCHWCHVMERESFEDEMVAAALNRDFISIKVDREERPDIDKIYMDACAALSGSGGWPLTCFLTPDRKPFFAGTYFPKEDSRYGSGLLSILPKSVKIWKERRHDVESAAESILLELRRQEKKSVIRLGAEKNAFDMLKASFDESYGGFGGAPKFPPFMSMMFLLRYAQYSKDNKALAMVQKTLDAMHAGGIYDHVGGGFCRYSTDKKWLVPHFEKMMTDNALHIITYAEAGTAIDKAYLDTALQITSFCLREMQDPEGGFYTAIDADSEWVEGKYYVFTPDEIEKALGKKDGKRYCSLYHITPEGNFEGKSIPNLISRALTPEDAAFAQKAGERLRILRSLRTPPFRDEKISTAVNCLMIAALAEEGRILRDNNLISSAEGCCFFLLSHLIQNGRLQSSWREGKADSPATCDDYAYLIWGLLELYESTFKPEWLRLALDYMSELNRLFWDKDTGGYFFSGADVSDLPLRQKNMADGALPSGNAVACLNLIRLARITGRNELEQQAGQILELMSDGISRYPSAFGCALCALLYKLDGGSEVILTGGEGFKPLSESLPGFSPFSVSVACGNGFEAITETIPQLKEYIRPDKKAAAYVCRGNTCMQPVTDPEELKKLLKPDAAFSEAGL